MDLVWNFCEEEEEFGECASEAPQTCVQGEGTHIRRGREQKDGRFRCGFGFYSLYYHFSL